MGFYNYMDLINKFHTSNSCCTYAVVDAANKKLQDIGGLVGDPRIQSISPRLGDNGVFFLRVGIIPGVSVSDLVPRTIIVGSTSVSVIIIEESDEQLPIAC